MYKQIALYSLTGGVSACIIAKFNDTLHNHQYTRKDYTKKFINGYLVAFVTLLTYEYVANGKGYNSGIIKSSQSGGSLINNTNQINTNQINSNQVNSSLNSSLNNNNGSNKSNFDYFTPKFDKSKLNFNNGTPNF